MHDFILYFLIGLGICCFFSLFAQPIRALVQGVFAIFYHPLNVIMENLRDTFRRIWNWVGGQLRRESGQEGESPIYFLVGASIYTILFAIFALCDYGVILLTAEGMGLEKPNFKLFDTSTLTALTLISTSLFWGTILTDLVGWTHLGPWRRYSSLRTRKILFWTSLSIIGLAIFTGASMGYWRMWNLKEVIHTASAEEIPLPSLDKGGIENIGSKFNLGLESTNEKFPASQGRESSFADFVFLMAPTTIAALSFVSTVPAGWGLAFLLKFLILLAIAGSSMIIGVLFFPFWIVTVLLWRLLTAIQLLCDLLVEIGGSFLRLFNFRPPSQTGTPTQVETANAPSQPAIEPSSPTPISGNGHHDEIGFNPFRRQQ